MKATENTDCAHPAPSSSAKGLWIKLILGITIFLAVIVAGITYLIFSPWQEISATDTSVNDLAVQYRLMRRISKEFSKSQKDPNRRAVLKLTPQEINSLFRLVGNVQMRRSPYPIRYYRCAFNDRGEFSAVLPVRTSQKWLWGGTIYVKLVFTLSKNEGENLQCRIISCKLTSLPVSRDTAQKIMDRLMSEKKVKDQLTLVNSALKTLSFRDGKLCIEYQVQQILRLMVL